MTLFFGKHRGKVENNVDPLNQGRIQVSVPSVFGSGRMNWAMPCVPYAGDGVGFFFVPPRGANVWVEFEAGDTQKPIWSGCFWALAEAVPLNPLPVHKVLKTDAFELSILEPNPNAAVVEIKTASGFTIKIDPMQVEIGNGTAKIVMQGLKIDINNGALEVT